MSTSAKNLRPQNSNRTLFFTESEVFLDGVDISRKNPRNNVDRMFCKAIIASARSSDRELDTIQSLVQKIDENYVETSIFDKLKQDNSPKKDSPKKEKKEFVRHKGIYSKQRHKATEERKHADMNEEQPIINFQFKHGPENNDKAKVIKMLLKANLSPKEMKRKIQTAMSQTPSRSVRPKSPFSNVASRNRV